MIKACIFDLDGTLLDTLESIRFYLNKTLAIYGIRPITKEETKVFVGEGALNLTKRAMKAGGIDVQTIEGMSLSHRICEEYSTDYDSDPYYLTVPYPGIIEAISALKGYGIKLAVISNKPDPTVKQLIKNNFPDMFDIVEGAKPGIALKPDPVSVLRICEKLNVAPSDTVYFGDTATDMKTAKNYGAGLTVGVLWGFREREELLKNGADVLIENADRILTISGCV